MSNDSSEGITYRETGVDTEGGAEALAGLIHWVRRTESFRQGGIGASLCQSGHFATVLDLGGDVALAASTDGVGTKLLIAQLVDRYDTVGIDCVAMNVNDLVCIGADPIAMLDYLAVSRAEPGFLEAIGRGLHEGARQAGISIPGGELAQVPSMLSGARPDRAFDLVGTAIGLVRRDSIITGATVEPGHVIVGLASSGLHSNGYSLARKVLIDQAQLSLDATPEGLEVSLGEELLRPTTIYVDFCRRLERSGVRPHWLCHVTGDGLLNLLRCEATVRYVIQDHPSPPPIFGLIESLGPVERPEMFRTFNMGVGFCAVVAEEEVDQVLEAARQANHPASRIGIVEASQEKEVFLPDYGLIGRGDRFQAV